MHRSKSEAAIKYPIVRDTHPFKVIFCVKNAKQNSIRFWLFASFGKVNREGSRSGWTCQQQKPFGAANLPLWKQPSCTEAETERERKVKGTLCWLHHISRSWILSSAWSKRFLEWECREIIRVKELSAQGVREAGLIRAHASVKDVLDCWVGSTLNVPAQKNQLNLVTCAFVDITTHMHTTNAHLPNKMPNWLFLGHFIKIVLLLMHVVVVVVVVKYAYY